jgi:hypothetical protein
MMLVLTLLIVLLLTDASLLDARIFIPLPLG